MSVRGATPVERPLPPIVFVARRPPALADSGQVPGLGPHGTFAGRGGRLLERASDGTVRELLPAGSVFDVADPVVSADGERVAFSARETDRSPWRIWAVARAGGGPVCLTCPAEAAGDDADPLWWGDTLLFVSTRGGGRALYDGTPLTQMWAMAPGDSPRVLTAEPNGVLDPATPPARDRVWFSRWWFNPWQARDRRVVRDALAPSDSVNQWQAVSGRLASSRTGTLMLTDVRLAAGGALPRRRSMALQSAPLPGGGAFAVAARNMGLAPQPGPLAVLKLPPPPGSGVRWSGAAMSDETGDTYAANTNLAPPAALAPAPLPDGRLVCALDPGGRGEYGLCLLSADGESHRMLVDVPGEWELDPAVVPLGTPSATAKRHDVTKSPHGTGAGASPTFRYLARDVFAGAGAPPRSDGAELHVYELVSPDSVRRIRRLDVPRSGRVDVRLPASTPLFEVLVARGGVLATPHGPAQVRGFNSGAQGTTSSCSGCHLGHSVAR